MKRVLAVWFIAKLFGITIKMDGQPYGATTSSGSGISAT